MSETNELAKARAEHEERVRLTREWFATTAGQRYLARLYAPAVLTEREACASLIWIMDPLARDP